MLKQEPDVKGKTLDTWRMLGPLNIDEIENNSKCLFVIDDG